MVTLTLPEFSLLPRKKLNIWIKQFFLSIYVQPQDLIFWLWLQNFQIHFLILIYSWEILRVLGSISAYKHDILFYENILFELFSLYSLSKIISNSSSIEKFVSDMFIL